MPSPPAPHRAILAAMILRRSRTWVLATLVAVATVPAGVGMSSHAQAAELTKQQARELFQEALALVAAGDYASALNKLQRVASFKRTPQVVYYIGVCHEKTGKLVMALGEYRIALADARVAGADDVVTEATDAIAKLEPRIPMLTISKGEGAQAATITVDGKDLGDAAIDTPMPFDPGTRVVVAQASGYKPFRKEVKLGDGEKVSVEVTLQKRTEVAGAVPPTDESSDQPEGADTGTIDTEGGSNALAWVATGVGVVGLGASAYFFTQRSKAISDLDEACGSDKNGCPTSMQSTYDDGKQNTMLGNIALGVGVVGVMTGVILFASSASGTTSGGEQPTQPEQPSVGVRLSSPGSWAGLSVDGRF